MTTPVTLDIQAPKSPTLFSRSTTMKAPSTGPSSVPRPPMSVMRITRPDICQVASDNLEAGRLAARKLAEVQPESKVVILHSSVNKACIDRVDGFKEEAAKHPGFTILDTQEGKGTTEVALPVMRDLLARFPECNAVFPINDPSAFGAISAIESAGKLGKVLVVTVDGSKEAVDVIKTGKLLSTSAQFPREIGRISAEKVYEHLEGKQIEKEVKIPVELVTKENADTFIANKAKGPSK